MTPRAALSVLALLSSTLPAFALPTALPSPQATAPFTVPPVNNRREFTNLNVETNRGVLWSTVDGFIYGLNTNGSQVVVHSNLDGTPDQVWQTISMPVAIAEWSTNRILVIGAGTHALAVHNRANGTILNAIRLKSEPADIVVDPDNNLAFVSCQGANQVLKINLATMAIIQTINVPSERPRFLYFDRGVVGNINDNRVFVAPFLSGNNSISRRPAAPLDHTLQAPQVVGSVVDLDAESNCDLPDEDLFSIPSLLANGQLEPMFKRAGTLLGPHGRPPWTTTGYWMLNVESLNKDPQFVDEPSLRGQFAKNRLSIGQPALPVPSGLAPPCHQTTNPIPTKIVDIDSTAPSGTGPSYSQGKALSFPMGLAFHPSGFALVSASLSDKIGFFDSTGERMWLVPGVTPLEIPLAEGSIPRHIQLDPFLFQNVVVHCWGTNLLEVWTFNGATPVMTAQLQLGVDPAPKQVREGRAIWYDADRSKYGRFSCNTCHPGGKSDNMAWMLSDVPHDHKNVMFTQSLLSIEDTFPYHWRGERNLEMFNGAFTGLLGHSAVLTVGPNSEFDKLQAFIFSLQAHANPLEDDRRIVVATGGQPAEFSNPGNAVTGQTVYMSTPAPVSGESCNACHTLPTSSGNDFALQNLTVLTSQVTMEVPHLRELTHRDQKLVGGLGNLFSPAVRTGFGLTHDAAGGNLRHTEPASGLLQTEQDNVLAFIRQLDNGLAPAAHIAFLLTPTSPSSVTTSIQTLLQAQASTANRWIDVVAFGNRQVGTGPITPVRWLFNPATSTYVANETGLFPNPLTLNQLRSQAAAGGAFASITVLGLPPGNGRRFAVDPDNDNLVDILDNVTTATSGNPRFNPDVDGDTWPDGYEAANGTAIGVAQVASGDTTTPAIAGTGAGGAMVANFVTTSVAQFFATTTEDAIIEATFSTPGLPVRTYRSTDFARVHTIVLQGLEGSTAFATRNYTATFVARDRAGLVTPPTGARTATFNSRRIVDAPTNVDLGTFVVRDLTTVRNMAVPAGTLDITSTFTIEGRDPGSTLVLPNPVGHVISAQVLIKRANNTQWEISNTFTSPNTIVPNFLLFGVALPYAVLPSPYVLSLPTTAIGSGAQVRGQTTISIVQTGLFPGDEVALRVRGIMQPSGAANTFAFLSLGAYQMPATDPKMREAFVKM